MAIDHEQLRIDLEQKFADRFTEKDEDYAKALKLKTIEPPCIYPWFNHQNQRRSGYRNQYNQPSNQYNQTPNQYNQRYPQQSYQHSQDRPVEYKKRRHD